MIVFKTQLVSHVSLGDTNLLSFLEKNWNCQQIFFALIKAVTFREHTVKVSVL